jgi:serralysin
MATCQFCLEQVKDGARKCPHCQSDLTNEQQPSKNVIMILDKGLVTFAKFALPVLGGFAFILYTAMGFHIQESVKEIETQSKTVNELHSKMRDVALTSAKEGIENQREIQKLRDEIVKMRDIALASIKEGIESQKEIQKLKMEIEKNGTDFTKYISDKTTEIERLRSDVEKTKTDSNRMLSEVIEIQKGARVAGDDITRIKSQIERAMRREMAGEVDVSLNQARPKLWPRGTELKVWFLDGDNDINKEIMEIAGEWSAVADIKFLLAKNQQDSDLRVTLSGQGTWSYIGTDNRNIPNDRETIKLGGLRSLDRANKRFNVLHEFGHVLGFLHELQNPKSNIYWNLPAMQTSLGFSNLDIENNFTKPYPPEKLPCIRDFDPRSVMIQPIPKEFTLNGQEFTMSLELSASDKQCANKMYPPS